MPRLYGERPDISQEPDQQSGLAVNLQPVPEPAPEAAPSTGECVCDVDGVFWSGNGTYWPGTDDVYDQTSITLTSIPPATNMPKAGLVGDTCPGSDLSGITASYFGTGNPRWEVVQVDQVWALVMTVIPSGCDGTLTVTGTIDCGGDTISVGTITLVLDIPGGG